jgi:uncharacterized protein
MPVAIIIALIVLLIAVCMLFAAKIIYPKVFTLEETRLSEIENERYDEAEYEQWQQNEFSVSSPFEYEIACAYFPLEGSQKTVVISHGITWSRYGSIKYMSIFRKRGFNILIYDLRNHGLSGGKTTTFGLYEKFDLQILVDWAFQQLDENGIVGTLGESLGAATTLQHAAIDKRISFAIADCPFSDLGKLLKYRFKEDYHLPATPLLQLTNLLCKLLANMPFQSVSPIRDIPAITTPIFWIHGQEDDYIPPEMSQCMYDAKIKGIRKIYLAPNAAHAKSQINNPVEYDQRIGEFLEALEIA